MEFYEKAAEYLQLLKDNINRCDKTIKKAPPGILRAKKRGQHFEYYCLKNKKETYLNKSNESLIISLGASTYAQNYKKYALNEIDVDFGPASPLARCLKSTFTENKVHYHGIEVQ